MFALRIEKGLVRMGANTAVLRRLLCGTALVAVAGIEPASAAAAQPQSPVNAMAQGVATAAEPQEPQATQTPIVITGSRIPRTNLTAVSPVTVVPSAEIKLEGAVAIEELLNQLPQVRPGQGLFVSDGATGTAEVDLRGLGPARTLVLINSRRVGPGDKTVPDINSVPASLIQRIEVLTGGAAAVYGSDAVAGVVNFILDTGLRGLRVDAQASFFQHNNDIGPPWKDLLAEAGINHPSGNVADGGRQDINAAFGHSFLDDRAHVTVYGGYRNVSEITQDRRDYSACAFGIVGEANPNITSCSGSEAAFPGNFFTFFDVFQLGPDRTFEPGFVPYNFAPFNYFQRSDRRYTGGGFADFEISQAIHPYLEVMYMDDRSLAQIAPSADFLTTQTINCDNPLLSVQQRSLVCFPGNFVGEEQGGAPIEFVDPVTGGSYLRGSLFIGRRNVEGGPRQDDLRHKNLRLVGGLKGDLGRGVVYDVSYISTDASTRGVVTGDLSVTRMRRALDVINDPQTGQPVCRSVRTGEDADCVPWDIFVLGGVTPQVVAYMDTESTRRTKVTEKVANANSTIDLGEWALRSPWSDETPSINFGAEYRKDRLDFDPDEAARSGDLVGTEARFPIHGAVTIKELFGEIRLPLVTKHLVESLTFEGGYRHSWYRNSESNFRADAYKLALDLTAVRGLRLRASQQRAVRAPNIAELFTSIDSYEFPNDPCAGSSPDATFEECARTGVSAAQYGHILAVPDAGLRGYNAIFGGNPDLQPETATTRTIGIVLEPRFVPGFNLTVDWWDIDLKGWIFEIGAEVIMDTCIRTGDPLFCGRVHRDSSGSLWLSHQGFVDDRNANIGTLKTRGIDVGANYVRKLGRYGKMNLGFLGSRQTKNVAEFAGISVACLGRFGFPCPTPFPRWRHTARVTWEPASHFSLSLNWRHIAAVDLASIKLRPEEPFYPGDATIGAQNYLDLATLFRITPNYELRLGVNNLLDRSPPVLGGTANTASGQGTNGNTYPSLYDALGRYFFVGVAVNH
ncbi:TonB-dependent receptor plug domain-containing protein [Sphingomonas hankyongi]|uniref:TonB-dependent receptor n=1 Tax=Sphingomonas hankyongi TaxID=2908209 RepID=A0ABT0S1P2_9SPHN|nr:TonB-dependent receptor [Sphingomonas hankyongi]MCL6729773.1 TonB-dependent receptor [Sphingomonas hankyongi]